MTLFVYGEFGPMAMENSMIPVWQSSLKTENVHLIERIPLPKKHQLLERICRKITPQHSFAIRKHNEHIVDQVAHNLTPQSALIVFKGMEIFPKTLNTIKKLGVKLFCYNPDHPFVYSGTGSGSNFMSESLQLYDLYFTYHNGAKQQLSEMSVKSCIIPFGYESMAMEQPYVSADDEILRGCFIGNPNPERVKFFQQINGKLPIELYGSRWDKHFKPSNLLKIHGPVHDKAYWEILSRYRFQFNLMARHNPDTHNMRTFSAPASGAIMLAPRNKDHEIYFTDRKEVYLFDNVDESIELGHKLLGLTYDEAMEIRQGARRRCFESGYSYSNRATEILLKITEEVS